MSVSRTLNLFFAFRRFNRPNRSMIVCKMHEDSESPPKKTFKRKVKETVELITLIDSDGKIMGLKPKHESEALAKKRNMVLQPVLEKNMGRTYPTFKLVSAHDIFVQETSQIKPSSQRQLKRLPINSKISEHDLVTKLKTMQKWLSKKCEIHIAVMSKDDTDKMRRNILQKIEEHFKNEARILNIRSQEEALKFIIMPLKEVKSDSDKSAPKDETSIQNTESGPNSSKADDSNL